MFEISLFTLLIAYGVLVLIFFVFAGINIYHLMAFGFFSFKSIFMTFFLIAGTILILGITFFLGLGIDWSVTFVI